MDYGHSSHHDCQGRAWGRMVCNFEQSGVCAFGSFARPGIGHAGVPARPKASSVAPSRASPIEESHHAGTLLSETSFKPDQTEEIAKAFGDAWDQLQGEQTDPVMSPLVRSLAKRDSRNRPTSEHRRAKAAG
jgi:hypothetical protein